MSLCNPVKVFVNENKDIAFNLQQEFIRIRPHMEADREAIVAGLFITAYRVIFLKTLSSFHYILAINCYQLCHFRQSARGVDFAEMVKLQILQLSDAPVIRTEYFDVAG